MSVTLIDYTGFGCPDPSDHAMNVLIFSKQTRLTMDSKSFESIAKMTQDEKNNQLEYMSKTIPSSWEFVHYTFLIENVTRAFTHQLVRTRTASFAQQTMRVLNMQGFSYGTGPTIEEDTNLRYKYRKAMQGIHETYESLIAEGAAIEDARGVLPTNIHTNILMSCSLRTFVELVQKRSSPRTQGEYREFLEELKDRILEVHPWVHMFVNRTFDLCAKELDQEISEIGDPEKKIRMIKLVDQLRRGQGS
jgi:flavin-dependent thymidylate synthase